MASTRAASAFSHAAETSPLIAPLHSLPRFACACLTVSLLAMSAVWDRSLNRCHCRCAVRGLRRLVLREHFGVDGHRTAAVPAQVRRSCRRSCRPGCRSWGPGEAQREDFLVEDELVELALQIEARERRAVGEEREGDLLVRLGAEAVDEGRGRRAHVGGLVGAGGGKRRRWRAGRARARRRASCSPRSAAGAGAGGDGGPGWEAAEPPQARRQKGRT